MDLMFAPVAATSIIGMENISFPVIISLMFLMLLMRVELILRGV